jgi:hypothetical protein
MGMFSYVCTKCGEKEQFDFCEPCVVKIGDIYVNTFGYQRGDRKIRLSYMYALTLLRLAPRFISYRHGSVYVGVTGKTMPVNVNVIQFQQYCRGGEIVWSEIYCADGGSSADKGEPLSAAALAQQHGTMITDMLKKSSSWGFGQYCSESDDPENRNCVPKDLVVLDKLEESML